MNNLKMKTALEILNQVELNGELLDTDKAIEAMELYAEMKVKNLFKGKKQQCNIPVVINWVAIKDELPYENRLLITWSDKTSSYRICRYMKSLTWKGYKYKFVNVHSKGMWDEDATHWTYFPKPPCL